MSRPASPPRPPAPGTSELRAVLQDGLRHSLDDACHVTRLVRSVSIYSTSSSIENLEVGLADGRTLPMVFKDVGWAGLLDGARRSKPSFLYDPLREIQTYKALLTDAGLGTPTCYATLADERLGRYWLFLERVRGVELYQVGELGTWQHVAAWLARLHDRWSQSAQCLAGVHGHLLRYDADLYRCWSVRAGQFAGRVGASKSQRRSLERLTSRYHRVVERLVGLPTTLIHGEFYASNVLVQRGPEVVRVCPVDWETAALGPGLIDLAALTAGPWSEQDRSALASAYRSALTPAQPWPPSTDEFLELLDCCRLHLALQWLGWSPDWTPPPEHAHDWLGEALRLGDRLGL